LDRRTKTALAVTLGAIVCLSLGIQEGSHPVEVTFEEGTNFAVALSPDGSNLVLDLQGTLWSLPVEGGEGRALTDGLGDDRLPDYSPDGRRVVFQSYRSGSWDIWAIGSDGNGLEPLTHGPFDDREPVWSPDGTSVAFSSDRSGNYDICILNVASGEVAQLTIDDEDDYMPTWSPDGSVIAFLSDRGAQGTTELWRIGAPGGPDSHESKIASFEGRASSPSWSRDGRQIVLQLLVERVYDLSGWRFSEGIASDLVLVPSRGGESTKMTSGEDVFPFRAQWMRNRGLIYTADGHLRRISGRAAPQDIPFSVKVTLDRPAYPRRAASLSSEGRLPVRGIVGPVLSPDGKRLAFSALGDIWIARADGLEPMLLTRDEHLDSDPDWSPDGRDIVFSSDRAGSMDLWWKKADAAPGGEATRLTDLPGAEVDPEWSPDGLWIAFTDEEDRLQVIPAEGGRPRLVRTSRTLPSTGAASRRSSPRSMSASRTS